MDGEEGQESDEGIKRGQGLQGKRWQCQFQPVGREKYEY